MILTPPGREDEDSEEEDGLKGMRIPIARTGEPRKEGGALVCEVCGPVLCLSYICALLPWEHDGVMDCLSSLMPRTARHRHRMLVLVTLCRLLSIRWLWAFANE